MNWDVFLSVLVAIVLVQILKFILMRRRNEDIELSDMWVDGGVISAHSGAVSALTMAVYLSEGFSNLFFVSLIFTGIVLRDAFGVRKLARENAKILNKKFKLKKEIREGHSMMEVVRGVVIGVIVAVVIFGI